MEPHWDKVAFGSYSSVLRFGRITIWEDDKGQWFLRNQVSDEKMKVILKEKVKIFTLEGADFGRRTVVGG